jgi:ketosteroid isomerase-like protein
VQTNVELVQMLYKAFGDGRIDTILKHCSDTIAWDCVGNPAWVPLAGTRSGKDAVRRFFEELGRGFTFEEFSPDSFHDAGDHVFCFGHSRSRAAATGQTINDRFLHAFRIKDGKVAAFTEFMDTAAVAVGCGTLRVTGEGAKAA